MAGGENSRLFKWGELCDQFNQTVTLIIGCMRIEGDLKLLLPKVHYSVEALLVLL